jgi:hypothetical protein
LSDSRDTHSSVNRRGLYYPFHLCHERTLSRLLADYDSVPFPELVAQGRIVQGYDVSGPLAPEVRDAVDRDLADPVWRDLFHTALKEDRRFQRGLFDLSHVMQMGRARVPGPMVLLRLLAPERKTQAYSLHLVQDLTARAGEREEGYDYEYGLALTKTSASLVHTIQLGQRHSLEAVTDSRSHFDLLEQTCRRDNLHLSNHLLTREGY